ncbi:potassium channel family protein [Brevibacterium luteolum]|uniref:potassium channel family protein n=1 Tax=Brevibacterium luteolum TaxID=199591 RepID=UPI00223BB8E5|nr:potassium channel family protein [Brevibacterium luteolum]MCT1874501.1 ion channel [Brevibacterium luteolum]MCT1891382.1 ion channel [Brevibacterium luteolum]MCT1894188.1 ion channel [Brevibacterium luteolum]MCT1925018.1 ion channel [Brevibacterium luteolum]
MSEARNTTETRHTAVPPSRYQRWQQLTEWPMAIAAVIFLGAYAYVVIGNLRPSEIMWPERLMLAIWVVFAIDYIVSFILVRRRFLWFWTHLHELALVIFPFLRPLYLLRLITLIGFIHRTAGARLRGKVTFYICTASVVLVFVAALAVLDAEQNYPGANITSFGDALWWAVVTITTVGYGDHFPITALGRIIAVGLMICGIALIGSVTATLASWIVDTVSEDEEAEARHRSDDAAALHERRGPAHAGELSDADPGVLRPRRQRLDL